MPTSSTSAMAQQFMELWQKQMSNVLNDQQFLRSYMELMKSMQMPGTASDTTSYADSPDDATSPTSANALNERLDEFDFRLRMLEKRIGELESAASLKPKATKKSGGGSAKPRRKPASGASKRS